MPEQSKKSLFNLNQQELRDLKRYGFDGTKIVPAAGQDIVGIIFISHGTKYMHEAGYPFIKILGVGLDNVLIDLGWHDHFLTYYPTNTDCFGKNVFHVMPWHSTKWRVTKDFMSCSTFEIGRDIEVFGGKNNENLKML